MFTSPFCCALSIIELELQPRQGLRSRNDVHVLSFYLVSSCLGSGSDGKNACLSLLTFVSYYLHHHRDLS